MRKQFLSYAPKAKDDVAHIWQTHDFGPFFTSHEPITHTLSIPNRLCTHGYT